MLKLVALSTLYIILKAFGWCLVSFAIAWELLLGFEGPVGFAIVIAGIIMVLAAEGIFKLIQES
jgi:F420-dependent methylenetetrahydromethanopterin dehydrogenase